MMLQREDYRVTEPRLEVMSADHTIQPTCSSRVTQSRGPGPYPDENLQGWRLHNLCGQPVSESDCPHSEKSFSGVEMEFPGFGVVSLLPIQGLTKKTGQVCQQISPPWAEFSLSSSSQAGLHLELTGKS